MSVACGAPNGGGEATHCIDCRRHGHGCGGCSNDDEQLGAQGRTDRRASAAHRGAGARSDKEYLWAAYRKESNKIIDSCKRNVCYVARTLCELELSDLRTLPDCELTRTRLIEDSADCEHDTS
eukprot:gene6373-biopygen8459